MASLKTKIATALVTLLAAASFGAQAQMVEKKALSLAAAKSIAAAAEAEAVKNKWNVVIVVVDEGGQLLYLQRMDGTQYGSVDVAIKKARTSSAFKRPTKVFEDATAGLDSSLRWNDGGEHSGGSGQRAGRISAC